MANKMKIMIVDDREENRYLLETLLGAGGYETVTAPDGKQALEQLRQNSFDLIVSDILMPVMDGFQLCRTCKADETLGRIPFVFYTATYVDDKDEAFAYRIGADLFLQKANEPDKFLEAIREVVEKTEKGEIGKADRPEPDEKEIAKDYSDRLVRKLEHKMERLEAEIEERKQAEKTIRKLSKALEQSPSIVMLTDTMGVIEYVNPKFEDVTGYTADEVIGTKVGDLGEQAEETAEEMFENLNFGKEWRGVFRNRKKNGETYLEQASISPMFDEKGEIINFVKVAEDITRLKETQMLLKESEDRYRNLIDVSPVGIGVHAEGKVVFINRAGAGILKASSPDELVGRPVKQIVHPDRWESSNDRIRRMMEGEKGLYPVEDRYVRLDGKPIDVTVMATPLYYKGKPAVQVVVQDITEKKQAEWELKARSEVDRIFLNCTDGEIYKKLLNLVLDTTESQYGIFGFVNEKNEWVCPALTRDIFDGCRMADKDVVFSHDSWAGIWRKAMTEKRPIYKNRDFCLPEGHIILKNAMDVPVVYNDELVGNFLVGHKESGYEERHKKLLEVIAEHLAPLLKTRLDIDKEASQRRIAEEKYRHAQKMESIGSLAGGIAHDFNNILSAILGYTQLAMDEMDRDGQVYKDLLEVYNGVERARKLVQQILAFSREREQKDAPIQLEPVVKEALKFLRSTLPSSVDLSENIEPELANVMADPTRIHQIIMNLCTNAAHAMQEKGGTLTVDLSEVSLDPDAAGTHPDLEPGDYVRVTVSDTGHGIDPASLPRIFDPYFTTKSRGDGTGLGLSTAYGIVKSCKGAITVYSEPGKGTVFRVYLPAIRGRVKQDENRQEYIPGGDERILMVDDEPAIAELGQRMLAQLGYKAEYRTDPRDVLEFFKIDPDRFDLVITDLTMPGMTGDRLAAVLAEIRPDIPVLFCTGFSEHKIADGAGKAAKIEVVQKPFLKSELAAAVRMAIDRRTE
ncbi:MAG: PAS domain S-box protein [Desulfarculaceae bacterium]|nr:PAS domain S-box protein [Desulfarculaceae bacterium]